MRIKTAVLAAIVIFAACSCAFAQYMPEVLRVKGDPKIMKKGSGTWTSCKADSKVADGDRIKTAKDEVVVVGFVENRKNIVRIGSDSEAVITDGTEPDYAVDLLNGEAMALLLNLPQDSQFEVRTPAGIAYAHGTGWKSITDGKVSTFEAYDNSIYVRGVYADGRPMDNPTFINMGYKTTVNRLALPAPVQRISPPDIDRWNAWRDEVKYIQLRMTASGGTEKIDDLIRKK
jgi:hypothetical protein